MGVQSSDNNGNVNEFCDKFGIQDLRIFMGDPQVKNRVGFYGLSSKLTHFLVPVAIGLDRALEV